MKMEIVGRGKRDWGKIERGMRENKKSLKERRPNQGIDQTPDDPINTPDQVCHKKRGIIPQILRLTLLICSGCTPETQLELKKKRSSWIFAAWPEN